MAVDKGFRRIVLSLMTLVTLSVITVGVYLYFNFKSRSSLPVIVPEDVTTFVHFQTRKMRDESGVRQPKYVDSLAALLVKSPLFKRLESPADAGISLYSDIVYFKKSGFHCLALSLTSESRFSTLLDSWASWDFLGNQITKSEYKYAKVVHAPLYIAYKYKAVVLVMPEQETDTAPVNTDVLEAFLEPLFLGTSNGFIKTPNAQKLYEKEVHWLAFDARYGFMGIAYKKGVPEIVAVSKGSTVETFEGAQSVHQQLMDVWRKASPESTNTPKGTQTGVDVLESYFQEIYYYLRDQRYAY